MDFDKNKLEYLNPEDYGLNKRQKLIKISDKEVGIVKMRKSRIIMKDGEQILEMSRTIRKHQNVLKVNLIISGPICSKTSKYLYENSVGIISISI